MAASLSISTPKGLTHGLSKMMQSVQASGCQFKERCEFRGCLELRDWIEIFERARERIGETPCRPRSEFLDPRIEIEIVDAAGQVLGDIQLALDECPVDDQLRGLVLKTCPLPSLDLLPHRLEVPLHAVHSHREDVHEAQMFGVLGEHGREVAAERHLRTLGLLQFPYLTTVLLDPRQQSCQGADHDSLSKDCSDFVPTS